MENEGLKRKCKGLNQYTCSSSPASHISLGSDFSRVCSSLHSDKEPCVTPLQGQRADLGGWPHSVFISDCKPDHGNWSRIILRDLSRVRGLVQRGVKVVVGGENNNCDISCIVAGLWSSVVGGNNGEGVGGVLRRR